MGPDSIGPYDFLDWYLPGFFPWNCRAINKSTPRCDSRCTRNNSTDELKAEDIDNTNRFIGPWLNLPLL